MAKFLIRAVFAGLGLWLAAYVVPGVDVGGMGTLVVAALLLGVVNAFVRPIVFVLTLPFTLVTLGLFLLILNAAMIGLVAWFLKGFEVHGLLPGIGAAIVTGLVSWIGHAVVRPDERRA